MPHSGSIIGQLSEELAEIGKQVARESAKVPKDIAGKAMESLGVSSGTKQGQTQVSTLSQPSEIGPLQELAESKDESAKRSIARSALEQIAGIYKKKEKEPTAWERIQMETEQKKQLTVLQQAQVTASQLPQITPKRPRGDFWGVKAKQTSAERKGARQD